MNHQEQSASTVKSASILLPTPKMIPPPTASCNRAARSVFTRNTVRTMHCRPDQREAFFWDQSCRGFGLRALSSGRRTWIYQYRDEHGRTRRIAIGDASAVSLDDARQVARSRAASVAHGVNPSVERKKKRAAGTVREAIEAYLSYAKARQRPRSYIEMERHLRVHAAPLHHDRIEAVRRRDIAALLDGIAENSGPIAANRVRASLSALWSWSLKTGRNEADSNPVTFTVRNPEKPRERTLNDDEIKAIWHATPDGGDYSRVTRLCLLTGCRREEISNLHWDEIQNDRIVIASERMKGKIAHEIPRLPMISAALPKRPQNAKGYVFGRRGTGFSGFSGGKERLDTRLEKASIYLPRWGLHDLRRSLSTRLHDAGIEPIVIESLLAHKQQGVAAVYNRASFREAKRAALTRWHEIVKSIVDDRT